MNNNVFVPERFRRSVVLHVVKHFLWRDIGHVPLLLGIHGPSGYGKTYQCEHVLKEIEAKAFLISGGQLESPKAGEPAELIRQTYLTAGRALDKRECKIAVILINDIDTGLGNFGEMTQYTVNTQTVFGELMHLVDYPTSVEGITTRAIPIIVTGNDFTKLYGPFIRAGRMTHFEWNPTLDEKAEIVLRIFPEITLEDAKRLIKELEKNASQALHLGFFSQLRTTLIDDSLWDQLQSIGVKNAFDMIHSGKEPSLRAHVTYSQLLHSGNNLIQSGQLSNHLRSK